MKVFNESITYVQIQIVFKLKSERKIIDDLNDR